MDYKWDGIGLNLEYEDAGGDGHRCPDTGTGEEKTSCRVPVKEEVVTRFGNRLID